MCSYNALSKTKAAIVIAASSMCSGGRIVNYLVEFLPSPQRCHFCWLQGAGTPGRLFKNMAREGYVELNEQRIDINAYPPSVVTVHTPIRLG